MQALGTDSCCRSFL